MARTSQIKIEVQKGNSVSTIKDIINAFNKLKKARDSVGKDGKIKVNVEIGGNSDVLKVLQNMKDLRTLSLETQRSVAMLRTSYKNLATGVNVARQSIDKLNNTNKTIHSSSLSLMALFTGIAYVIRNTTKEYLEYTDAVYGVGIASQLNLKTIDSLSKAFYDLSSSVPSTATGLAKAVDDLIRTGRSLEDSQKIIKEVAILSTASGDSLKDTAQVVTKVMVALNISGDRVSDTLSTMHSTAIQTASDMGYLAEAFKNVASGASVLAIQSGKIGEELDDYKQKILDISMASVGVLANTGLSASYFQ